MPESSDLLQHNQHRVLNNIVGLKRLQVPPATPLLNQVAASHSKVTPRLCITLLHPPQ
jgi:hypothetical protein